MLINAALGVQSVRADPLDDHGGVGSRCLGPRRALAAARSLILYALNLILGDDSVSIAVQTLHHLLPCSWGLGFGIQGSK